MVIVLPSIVATAKFELVYVIKPLLLDVGGTIVKGASPMFFKGIVKIIVGSAVVRPRTSRPAVVKTVEPRPNHVVPFTDVAMVFPPSPVATHKLFVYLMSFPLVVKTLVPSPVHVVPFVEVAMLFPPEPTAIHRLFAYVTPIP